jgi:hypothetical protein
VRLAGGEPAGERHTPRPGTHWTRLAGISASVSVAGVMRSSTNVFHS